MRFSTILSTLMLTTALTACGGGGGGGHTNIPHTTLPNVGTSIKAVNNTQERITTYEDALTSVGITTETSAENITNAYKNMEKILVQEDVSTATKEDILLSLALVGEDIEKLKDKSLDELKSEIQKLDIKEKAEDVYAKLGTERNLSLIDVEFYGPFEDDRYAFIVDENQNVTGLKINEDDSPTGVIEYTNADNGVYKNTKGYTRYGFVFNDGKYDAGHSVIVSKDATKDEIKEAFKNKINGRYGAEVEEAVLAWLDSADLGEFIDEDTCDKRGNCFYKESLPQSVKMDSLGKSVGLKYSDFGKMDCNLGNEKEYMAYYGGYKGLETTAQDLPQVDTEMNFEGKSVAIVSAESWNENTDDESYKEKIFKGSMNLNFKDGKETLTADFTDWHKITVTSDTTNVGEYTFTFEGIPTDSDFTLTNNATGHADIKYYGENLKKPDEVVGTAYVSEYKGNSNGVSTDVSAEMAFGGIRK